MRLPSISILRIAAEGWLLLAPVAALVIAAAAERQWLWLALAVAVLIAAAAFFHDTPRHTVAKPSGILAPCDGVVSFRRECHDPWLHREAIRIGITVPWFANYLLRAPVEGEVGSIEAAPRRVSALVTDEGQTILVVAARGSVLGASPIRAEVGERIGQGRICGARRLARVIEVYLPAECRVEVQLGQKIRCGETVLATLLRRTA